MVNGVLALPPYLIFEIALIPACLKTQRVKRPEQESPPPEPMPLDPAENHLVVLGQETRERPD